MKGLMLAALIAGQAIATSAAAADLGGREGYDRTGTGAFAGARVRLPFGGSQDRKVQAGLTLAPTLHGYRLDGSTRLRFGEGVELGFSGGQKAVRLSLAGSPVSSLTGSGTGPDGRTLGISTIGAVAIGVGVVLIAGIVLLEACKSGEVCSSDRDD